MFRLIFIILFLILFFIISIPIYLVLYLIGLCSKNVRDKVSLAIVRGAFRIILFLAGTKVTVYGKENIPKDTACLFVGNHSGFFDILVGYTQTPGLLGFVSKKEIQKVPFLNLWMYFVNCIFLDRKNMRAAMQMLVDGMNKIKEGISIFIFPEGTRSKNGKMAPFKEGSFKMATKTSAPIVPVAFTGTAEIFENQFPRIRKSHVTISYGKPLYPDQFDKETQRHIGELAQKEVKELLEKVNS